MADDLYGLTDEQLEAEAARATKASMEESQRAFDCKWHLTVRKNMTKQKIEEQISTLQNQLKNL